MLREKLDRDAIVIGDGGDFVSYAGRFVDVFTPGAWLDPGPYGCLGLGLGYTIAARVVHPDKQVVLLAGDGAIGFSGMDMDTLVRHKLPVVIIVGNNGIWGLEKHPMQAIYGYDVAADLNQDTRYDLILEALRRSGGDRRETIGARRRVRPRGEQRRPVSAERDHRSGERVSTLVESGLVTSRARRDARRRSRSGVRSRARR